MDLTRVDTTMALVGLYPLGIMFAISAIRSPLGSVSLPCLAMMTSFTYFYLMPVIALAPGDKGFFGMYMSDMLWLHFAVLLYNLGAIAAFLVHWRVLNANPEPAYPWDRPIDTRVFLALWGIAVAGVAVQVAIGNLSLMGDDPYRAASDDDGIPLKFLTQAYNLLVGLTLVLLIRERFSVRSLIVLALVLGVFLQVGFRFRIMMLLAGAAGAFALQHRFKIGIVRGAVGFALAIAMANVIRAVRQYGRGIDLSNLPDEKSLESIATSFGGEFGPVYVLDYIASNPLPPPIWFEPWVVGVARLVPSILWPDKPVATYFTHFTAGATMEGADKAGIAAPQHVEILLQFGWWGLLPMAFCYFWIAGWLVRRLARTGREVRLAACTLIPFFFGFYMQSRGYFFQILADGLFILGPLFILSARSRKVTAAQGKTSWRAQP